VDAQRFHRAGPVAAQWTRLDQIVLAHMLVLEVGSHRDLPLKASIADRTVVGQCFGVGGEMLGQVVLAEESLLADAAFVSCEETD
jgi:hypothetical protein